MRGNLISLIHFHRMDAVSRFPRKNQLSPNLLEIIGPDHNVILDNFVESAKLDKQFKNLHRTLYIYITQIILKMLLYSQ